jgi:hypothetical protein
MGGSSSETLESGGHLVLTTTLMVVAGLASSMYLSIVFADFGIWSGGNALQTKQFCAENCALVR